MDTLVILKSLRFIPLKYKLPKDYILYFSIKNNQKLQTLCIALKNKTNLKVASIGIYDSSSLFEEYRLSRKFQIKPFDFVHLIKNASFVITDSYHAICFSIMFDKRFYIDYNSSNVRITDLLNTLNIDKNSDFYENSFETEKLLQKHVNNSISFLKEALEKNE